MKKSKNLKGKIGAVMLSLVLALIMVVTPSMFTTKSVSADEENTENVKSQKMGKKDILKIDQDIDINLDVLGYIDPDISVNIIRDGKLVEKKNIELPERLVGIKKCTNPRCITSTEQGIQHIFKLTDRAHRIYRCIYCEADK